MCIRFRQTLETSNGLLGSSLKCWHRALTFVHMNRELEFLLSATYQDTTQ